MPDDVRISDRLSDANAFLLRNVSNLRCSWEISRIGLLTFDVPVADLPAAALPVKRNLRKWIKYVHPTAGPWGGVVTSLAVRDGICTFDCESWAAMLRGVTTTGITQTAISTGLQQAIDNVKTVTGISWGSFQNPSPGEPDVYTTAEIIPGGTFFANGQDLYNAFLPSVMDRLYDEHGWKSNLRSMAWNIDPETRKFFLDMTYGRDLTQTVALRDRVHNLQSSWTDDVEDIANILLFSAAYNYIWQKPVYTWTVITPGVPGTPGGECIEWKRKRGKDKCVAVAPPTPAVDAVADWVQTGTTPAIATAPATTVAKRNETSIAEFGPITAVLAVPTVFDSEAALNQTAQTIVNVLGRNEQIVTIECADVGGIWASFREGDIIGVDLANSGRTGNMVVRTRALDTSRPVMIVSGEAMLT